jgi:hypothetical protein
MYNRPVLSPHDLGVSLVINPYTILARVIFTALYHNAGGPLEYLSISQQRGELTPLGHTLSRILMPDMLLAGRQQKMFRHYHDDLERFGTMLVATPTYSIKGEYIFAAFGQRGRAPFEVGSDVVGVLPGDGPADAALFNQPYVLANGSHWREEDYLFLTPGVAETFTPDLLRQ